MIDEISDRQYQAGRKELHHGIDRLVQRVGSALAATFRTMHRVQFDAPWATKKRPGCA